MQLRGFFHLLVILILNVGCLAQPGSDQTDTTLSNPVIQEHVDLFIAIINGAEVYNETEFTERFTPEFVDAAPLEDMSTILEELRAISDVWQVVGVLDEPSAHVAVILFAPADTGEPLLLLTISVDPSTGQVNGLLITNSEDYELENPPNTTQDAVDQIKAMGHRFNWMVADVSTEGMPECSVLAGEGAERLAPMGSMFKLWVLGAVVDAVEDGTISWDQLVFLGEEDRSLPSGIVQDDPPGSNRTVRELAELMISISDNTATDLLLKLVGRLAVEQAQEDYGHHDPSLNIPFVSTKELFILKLGGAEGDGRPGPLGEQYIEADEMGRRAILAGLENMTVDISTFDLATSWAGGPIAIEELEWFGTPMDLCNVMARLVQNEEAKRILAINPGIPDQQGLWSYVGYKGGSEPGVLGLSWYLVPNATDAAPRVVTATVWDQESVLDETQTILLIDALRDLSLNEEFVSSDSPEAPTSAPAEADAPGAESSPSPQPEDTEPEPSADEQPAEEDPGDEDPGTSAAAPGLLLSTIVVVFSIVIQGIVQTM